jgi:hypothetical protein
MNKARISTSLSPQPAGSNKSEKDLALKLKINHKTNHQALKMLTKNHKKRHLNQEL